MCGICCSAGTGDRRDPVGRMVRGLRHRGPDDEGMERFPDVGVKLGHTRLSILDLSAAGHQPMTSADGRYALVLNGEIYNYLELRRELADYPFRSHTDTEVLLAAYTRWGRSCLDHFIGMFAFMLWDTWEHRLWAVRDRFGVKPLYYHAAPDGGLMLASEIKALHAAGVPARPDPAAWAAYLMYGLHDHTEATFWAGIRTLPPGAELTWSPAAGLAIAPWYDLAAAVRAQPDDRDDKVVAEELLALLEDSVRLRFRSDVPVGICLSGGLDSSLLLGLVHRLQGPDSAVEAFSFHCGDPAYDETPWIERMLRATRHPWNLCRLDAARVPDLAAAVQRHQDEPYGGFPTLGMACVHERARERGVTVLLDGNGIDEAWAGYDYYARAAEADPGRAPVQGTAHPGASLADALRPDIAALAAPWTAPRPSGDPLRDLQYRDLRFAKIPRALRFNDRVSMMFSRELREPFLDHRIVELGLRQPTHRKIRDGQGKWLVREVARRIVPTFLSSAPKRPVQTPQREWLRGPLAGWARGHIEVALAGWGRDWFEPHAARACLDRFVRDGGDNSFPVWQLVNLGLAVEAAPEIRP
ncbi:MAG: asparagine synthase (glutamine-hydrolyzing) [Kiritimatiellaeota bacterium]|nr:asparagine synthase (glutamine-hydrolyzing) [Kiritimatiellota bacterium]